MARQAEPAGPGSSPSFEQFVAASAADLLRLAMAVSADRATAQDVVQSVLERAYRSWGRIGGLDRPDAYARRMVINEALTLRRRARRVVLTDVVPDTAPVPDASQQVGLIEELMSALRRLPARQRAAIALRYLYDLPDAQIAEHLGCREVTVRGYVLRGLRALRVDPNLDRTHQQDASLCHLKPVVEDL